MKTLKKIGTGHGDDYTISCLLDHNYFDKYYNMKAIDQTTKYKQKAFDADAKATQQINFTGNLARERNVKTTMFFIIQEIKETILDFSQGTVRVL